MRQLFYILFLLLVWYNLFAQSSTIVQPVDYYRFETATIDSGSIRVLYALNAVDINDIKTYDDLQRLDIGSKFSKSYSFFIFNCDSLKRAWMKKNPNSSVIPTWLGERGKKEKWSIFIWSVFVKDFSENILTEYALMPHFIPNYQYSENLPVQEWDLHDDTITVCGYLCQKATCHFRGREYTAWFAPEIPVGNGPWKFGGLPGLILKVYDSERFYVFECIKIESHTKKYPIIKYDEKIFKKIEQSKLRQLDKSMYKDFYTVGGWNVSKTGAPPYDKFIPLPYHPLELE